MSLVFASASTQYCTGAATYATYPFLIGAWIKRDSTTGEVMNSGTAGSLDQRNVLGCAAANKMAATSRTTAQSTATSTATTTDGVWTLVAAYFGASNIRRIYIGTASADNFTTRATAAPDRMTLAVAPNHTSGLFSGTITWPFVYSVANGTEATSLMTELLTLSPMDTTVGTRRHVWGSNCQTDLVGGVNLTAVNSPTVSSDEPSHLLPATIPVFHRYYRQMQGQ